MKKIIQVNLSNFSSTTKAVLAKVAVENGLLEIETIANQLTKEDLLKVFLDNNIKSIEIEVDGPSDTSSHSDTLASSDNLNELRKLMARMEKMLQALEARSEALQLKKAGNTSEKESGGSYHDAQEPSATKSSSGLKNTPAKVVAKEEDTLFDEDVFSEHDKCMLKEIADLYPNLAHPSPTPGANNDFSRFELGNNSDIDLSDETADSNKRVISLSCMVFLLKMMDIRFDHWYKVVLIHSSHDFLRGFNWRMDRVESNLNSRGIFTVNDKTKWNVLLVYFFSTISLRKLREERIESLIRDGYYGYS